MALAKVMPEESYAWSPMEGVRSVARVYIHIARYNYYYPEIALEVPSPMGAAEYDSWEEGVADKEKVSALDPDIDPHRPVRYRTTHQDSRG